VTAGTNFVDKLRTGKVVTPHTRKIYIAAFDPDLDTTGFATVYGTVEMGKYHHESHTLAEIKYTNKRAYSSAKRTWLMAEQISRFTFEAKAGAQNYVVIEAQEVYKNGKADANDLLRLAQITGQLQGRFALRSGCDLEIVLPKVWKQNKQKEGMHFRAIDELQLKGCVEARAKGLEYKAVLAAGGHSQHTMDALCMALWKAQCLARVGVIEGARLTNRT
jgi:hypothetical protein